MNKKNKKNDNSQLWISGVLVLLIIISMPIITNSLMFSSPPKWLAPFGIEEENNWIGYIASFYGAIIGGIVSGLFTYLGVKKTITAQRQKDEDEYQKQHRAIIEIHEIYNGDLFLKNLNQKNGRLIITEQYKNAINLDLDNYNLNYLELYNSGPGKALNCSIQVEVYYINLKESFFTKVDIPIIFENEKIYVPIDKIKDKDNRILAGEQYYIKGILLQYETFTNETLKLERNVNWSNSNRVSTDVYSIKSKHDNEYKPLFRINGTKNEWYYLRDVNH